MTKNYLIFIITAFSSLLTLTSSSLSKVLFKRQFIFLRLFNIFEISLEESCKDLSLDKTDPVPKAYVTLIVTARPASQDIGYCLCYEIYDANPKDFVILRIMPPTSLYIYQNDSPLDMEDFILLVKHTPSAHTLNPLKVSFFNHTKQTVQLEMIPHAAEQFEQFLKEHTEKIRTFLNKYSDKMVLMRDPCISYFLVKKGGPQSGGGAGERGEEWFFLIIIRNIYNKLVAKRETGDCCFYYTVNCAKWFRVAGSEKVEEFFGLMRREGSFEKAFEDFIGREIGKKVNSITHSGVWRMAPETVRKSWKINIFNLDEGELDIRFIFGLPGTEVLEPNSNVEIEKLFEK